MINRKCNRRWLEKEDIEKQLNDCGREKRNATEREKYWREKFHSESLDIEDERSHLPLCNGGGMNMNFDARRLS